MMMNYNNLRAMSRAMGLLLLLLVGAQATRRTGSNDSVSRLLRGIEQAKNLPPPSEALPAARRERRRLGWWRRTRKSIGIASNSTIKHDLRAFWQHLAAGWHNVHDNGDANGHWTSVEESQTNGIGYTTMGNKQSDLAYIKDKLQLTQYGTFEGVLTKIVREIDTTFDVFDGKKTETRRRLKGQQSDITGYRSIYAGSATTKTLKNYVRAIHMFLFRGINSRFGNLSETQKHTSGKWIGDGDNFKNLTKLNFSGEGVLTYMMRQVKETKAVLNDISTLNMLTPEQKIKIDELRNQRKIKYIQKQKKQFQ